MEERRIVVAHDAPTKYTINFFNSITGKNERYIFPEYKRGSKRDRTQTISEECYYFLKDETSAFKLGKLRVVTENVPEEIKKNQIEAEQEVISPDYTEEISEDSESEHFMDGYQLKVDDLIYSDIVLNWPMKILCREDCKGICRICGKDLNTGECGCDTFVPSPGLAGIKEIFNANKEV